jgi:hypothetical protein
MRDFGMAWKRLERHPLAWILSYFLFACYRHYHQNMTRATRVALMSATLVVAYILALFQFIPVPFFSKEHAEQILPVVSSFYRPSLMLT